MSAIITLAFGLAGCGGSSSSGAAANMAVAITQVSPAVGSTYGGTTVTITGQGFTLGQAPSLVRFGGLPASGVTIVDDTTIRATSPAGTPGSEIVVTVSNDQGVGTGNFRYLVPAPITSDLNDDGIADAITSAPFEDFGGDNAGAVYVFFGSSNPAALTDSQAADADLKFFGMQESGRFGMAMANGDLDGDGADDLVISSTLDDTNGTNNGAVYVFFGPLTPGVRNTDQADLVLTGETGHTGDQFGTAVTMGDVDDDGRMDLVVSAAFEDTTAADAGAVYVWLDGETLQSEGAENADMKLTGARAGDQLAAMMVLTDVTGDGRDDLLMSAPMHDPLTPIPARTNAGALFVVVGGNIASMNVTNADIVITGEENNDRFGVGLAAGDLTGDGIKDIMVGAPLNDRLGFNVGRVYLFVGGGSLSSMYSANADALISGQPSNDNFGEVVSCGDVNADGFDDVVVGAPRASNGAVRNGRSYVFYGASTMNDSVATLADMIQTGEPVSHEGFGQCAKVVDWNRDGLADVIVSAPGNDANGPSAGRVYVFRGTQNAQDLDALDSDAMLTGEAPGNLLGTAISNGQ